MLTREESGEPEGVGKRTTARPDAAAEKQARARRRSYIAVRYPEVREIIKRLAEERETLSIALKSRDGASGGDVKKLRERRAYVATRLEILRSEQKELAEERKLDRACG